MIQPGKVCRAGPAPMSLASLAVKAVKQVVMAAATTAGAQAVTAATVNIAYGAAYEFFCATKRSQPDSLAAIDQSQQTAYLTATNNW